MACPTACARTTPARDKALSKSARCAHLIDKGEKPACVKHCPGWYRKFGDLDDPQSDVSKLRAAKKTYAEGRGEPSGRGLRHGQVRLEGDE